MNNAKDKLAEVIKHLRVEAEIARRGIDDFSKRNFTGVRERATIHCLRRAADIVDGFILTAEDYLTESANILERGLFETLVITRWVTLSDENAQTFNDGAIYEMKRLARKNLKAGYAKIIHKINQEDKTIDFLQSTLMKTLPKRLRIEEMAKEANLEKMYSMYYGFQSMRAHGIALLDILKGSVEEDLYIAARATGGFICAINVIIKDWIVKREQTPMAEIKRITGI